MPFVTKDTAHRDGRLRPGCKRLSTKRGTRYFCGIVTAKVKAARKRRAAPRIEEAKRTGKCDRMFKNKRGVTLCVMQSGKKSKIVSLGKVKRSRS